MEKIFVGEKVVKLGLAEEVLKLHENGWSALRISEYLKKKGFNVSDQTIRNFLKWRKKADNNFEIVKNLTEKIVVGEKVSAFEKLLESLKLTDELIHTVETDESFDIKERVILLERLVRTKTFVASSLQRYIDELDISEILYRIFTSILDKLRKLFEEKNVDSELAQSVISVIKEVYTNFELKTDEK